MPALSGALPAQGYGYSREKDPLITGVKRLLAFSRSGDWEDARAELSDLDGQVKELKNDLGLDLAPGLREALGSEDLQRIGYELTHLVFQAMRQKLYWNLKESLARSAPARSRLELARFYYEEILSHAVRRADKAEGTRRHEEIQRRFDALRGTLGSPGLFGVGATDPDTAEFKRLADELETLLRAVYPGFLGPAVPEPKEPPR